jgi:hypothetical protein
MSNNLEILIIWPEESIPNSGSFAFDQKKSS